MSNNIELCCSKSVHALALLISPMNTKVSTVGAALAALENEELKLCYVEPLEYDVEGYSEPGSHVTIFGFE